MESSFKYLKQQYQFTKESREVLLEYCTIISPRNFIDQNTSFGRGGSIRNMFVHIVNTYQYWIANISLKEKVDYTAYEEIANLNEVIELFNSVDFFTDKFIGMDTHGNIEYEMNGVTYAVQPFKLFSHVITHEFHHKGQILSISRNLGYVPVDTDIIR